MGHHRGVPIEAFSAFDAYGGAAPPELLAGHLLVATPRLADPNFWRRVVLVLDHGGHGALGLVIDRPGGVAVGELLPEWHPLATPPAELFTGGPVARNALIGLARLTSRDGADTAPAPDRMEAPGGCRAPGGNRRPARPIRASWPTPSSGCASSPVMPGGTRANSRTEIEEGSWYVVPAEARDPISADPEGLWRRVLRRQGGALAVVGGFPTTRR